MDGTTAGAGVAPAVAAALEAARADIVTAHQARYRLLQRVRELRDSSAATATGYRTTRRLIEQLWHLDPGEATRLIADADDLTPPPR